MKNLLLIIAIVAFTFPSCINTSKETGVNDVKAKISTLRKLGFFEKFSMLNDSQLFDTLHKTLITQYSETFEKYYDPGMDLEVSEILSLDKSRAIFGDFEDDVSKGNNRYVALLRAFSDASAGQFQLNDIKEIWASEKGPITLSFTANNEPVEFHPEYHDDWLSEEILDVVNKQMRKVGNDKFYMFMNTDGHGLGQYFLFIRLRPTQKDSIQHKFGWKFIN